MSNPTALVSQFESDTTYQGQSGAGTWTETDPIRFDGGLWLEEGTTNYWRNPRAEINTSGVATDMGANGSLTRSTAFHGSGSASFALARLGAGSTQYIYQLAQIPVSPGDVVTVSCRAALSVAGYIRIRIVRFDAGAGFVSDSFSTIAPVDSDGDQYVYTYTIPADTTASILVAPNAYGTIGEAETSVGTTFYVTDIQVEKKSHATSVADEDMGDGYTDIGSGVTTRAASSVAIDPTGILAPESGSLAFRFRRKIDTGATETLLECGTAGAGSDYLSIKITSSDKLVVSWASDGGSAQTVTSAESIAVDTEYLVYTDWDGTAIRLSIDAGTMVLGTRDVVQGSWGAGDLVLEAT